jgi:hypothetical protein
VSIIAFLFVIGLVALIVVLYRRRRNPARLMWSDIGTIVDRSLRAYRRHFVPLLALSAICAPLGAVTSSSFYSILVNFYTPALPFDGGDWLYRATRVVSTFVLVMGSLGLGKTLLACGAALALRDEAEGQPVSLWRMLSRQPWRATIGLMLQMILPSLINAFFGILGLLATLSWRVAPAALIFEQLGARDAIKQGRVLVKPVRGQLADALVPLWLIGWLIVGAPMLGVALLIDQFVVFSSDVWEALTLLGSIVGGVFIAPLTGLGAGEFYLFMRDRSTRGMEATIEALYGAGAPPASQSVAPTAGGETV